MGSRRSGLISLFGSSDAMRRTILIGIAIFVANTGALVGAAFYDHTFYIDGDSLGLMELPGVWAILVGDMLTMSIVQQMAHQAEKLTAKFPAVRNELTKRYLKRARATLLNAIYLRSRHALIFAKISIFALLFWLNNLYQTLDPIRFYGYDVFDSKQHIAGFVAARIVFFVSWVVLVPYMAYVCLAISYTFFKLIRTLRGKSLLSFDLFHPDGCGGHAFLGTINVRFITGMLVIYGELTMVLIQHKKLNPGLASGFIIATAFLLIGTFITLYPLRGFLKHQQFRLRAKYSRELNKRYTSTAMAHLHYINSVSFSPYSGKEQAFVIGARLFPLAIPTFKAYLHFS